MMSTDYRLQLTTPTNQTTLCLQHKPKHPISSHVGGFW